MSTKTSTEVAQELAQAEREMMELQRRVVELRRQVPREPVEDHTLTDADGKPVRLSELFGEQDDLILVHNMGKGCPYCTLWADGFIGVRQHLENRAAFAVVSADPPAVMTPFAEGRGWTFRMLSNHGSRFAHAMGYEDESGKPLPGVSTFHRQPDGTIVRVTHAPFGPGDLFCSVWHLLDMLADGPDDWSPKFAY